MLELAKALADCDAAFFDGWILAGADIKINGSAVKFSNNLALKRSSKAVFEINGTDADGFIQKYMRVLVLLPKNNLKSRSHIEPIAGKMLVRHIFIRQEIAEYVAVVGDENIIHQGAKPIVPGLCMIAWLQGFLHLKTLNWKVNFYSPVYSGEEVSFYKDEKQIKAYQDKVLAFAVNLG